jgi:hypothetical protein
MTTKVVVEVAGHHVLVVTRDAYAGKATETSMVLQPGRWDKESKWIAPPLPHWEGYVTTTRTFIIQDLDPTDPRIETLPGPGV